MIGMPMCIANPFLMTIFLSYIDKINTVSFKINFIFNLQTLRVAKLNRI